MDEKNFCDAVAFDTLLKERMNIMENWLDVLQKDTYKSASILFLKATSTTVVDYMKKYPLINEKIIRSISTADDDIKKFFDYTNNTNASGLMNLSALYDYILHLIIPGYISLYNHDILELTRNCINGESLNFIRLMYLPSEKVSAKRKFPFFGIIETDVRLISDFLFHYGVNIDQDGKQYLDYHLMVKNMISNIALKSVNKPTYSDVTYDEARLNYPMLISEKYIEFDDKAEYSSNQSSSLELTPAKYISWFNDNMDLSKSLSVNFADVLRKRIISRISDPSSKTESEILSSVKERLLDSKIFDPLGKHKDILDVDGLFINSSFIHQDKNGNIFTDYNKILRNLIYIDLLWCIQVDCIPCIPRSRLLTPFLVKINQFNSFDIDYMKEYLDTVPNTINAKDNFKKRFSPSLLLYGSSNELQFRTLRSTLGHPGIKYDLKKLGIEKLVISSDGTFIFTFFKKPEEAEFLAIDTLMAYASGAPFMFPIDQYTVM